MPSETFLPILARSHQCSGKNTCNQADSDAEVTSTWLAPRTMMITSKLLLSICSTTCPTKDLRPVIVQHLVIAFEFLFELLLQLIALADDAVAPT